MFFRYACLHLLKYVINYIPYFHFINNIFENMQNIARRSCLLIEIPVILLTAHQHTYRLIEVTTRTHAHTSHQF